jgi:beta-glucosidase
MSLDEKLTLVHGIMAIPLGPKVTIPSDAIPGAGYIPGVPRLGIPALKETDASLGVAYVMGLRHDGATALPSGLASAASWDPQAAYEAGAMIGQEAWRKGFNVLLAGGTNLARDPRNGRNFEYLGEDPLLAGTMAGEAIRGIQDQHVISTVKHFALNDQETGRHVLNVMMDEGAARESDFLAFELAIERGKPGAVMCSYNRVNGPYACDSDPLLNGVLKSDWHYPGWVMSDWGAVPSTTSALHGLDQESGEQLDQQVYFGDPLRKFAESDPAYRRRLDDMVLRILRSMYAVGTARHPPQPSAIDFEADGNVARRVAEEGIVVLANPRSLLPLATKAQRIAIIGGHSDIGVISGGGSSQVAPPGGPAATIPLGGLGPLDAFLRTSLYLPSSPTSAIQARVPQARLSYDDGGYPTQAAALARRSDLVILFATKWMGEGVDAPDLTLPSGQDELIRAVTAANPNTVVVLETGGPVLMPWLSQAGAVVEAWYPGVRGGEAIARVLFGEVDASGRLPMTFPAEMSQLPNPDLPGATVEGERPFDVSYPEGSNVGYRWYAARDSKPLFSFGFGLSYTQFAFGQLAVNNSPTGLTATLSVTNTGAREGVAVPQIYMTSTPKERRLRLVGWARLALKPGENKAVSIPIDIRLLADWRKNEHRWLVPGGDFTFAPGESAGQLQRPVTLTLSTKHLHP